MTIDFNKPVQTRDGRPVTILTTRGRGTYEVMGYIGESDVICGWAIDGTSYGISRRDLINVPEKRVLYLNVYPQDDIRNRRANQCFEQREHADFDANYGKSPVPRIARVRIEYTEGQFDD